MANAAGGVPAAKAVRTHRLVPATWARPLGRVLPVVALSLGLPLAAGVAVRAAPRRARSC